MYARVGEQNAVGRSGRRTKPKGPSDLPMTSCTCLLTYLQLSGGLMGARMRIASEISEEDSVSHKPFVNSARSD